MFSLVGILSFLTGLAGPVATIVSKLQDTKIALAKAQTDDTRNKLQAEIEELHGRQQVLIAEAGNRLNAIMRGLLALGPTIYLQKVFIFDKVIGSFLGQARGGSMFTTDPLDDNLWKVVVAVMSFYFLYDMVAKFRR